MLGRQTGAINNRVSLHIEATVRLLKSKTPGAVERRVFYKAMKGVAAYSPSLPIASTGQPSMASVHCATSSSALGCFTTKV